MSEGNVTSRREFIRTMGMGAAALPLIACAGNAQQPARRPNVIVIYLDDVSDYYLGCYGGPCVTPRIDELARGGMRFTRFYVSSAVCTPSRYGLFTGRFASRSGALTDEYPHGGPVRLTWNSFIAPGETTLPMAMRDAGYVTGLVGKWHLSEFAPEEQLEDSSGFTPGSRDDRILRERYERQREDVAERGGFDWVDGLYYTNINGSGVPDALKFHNQEWQTEKALEFVRDNAGRPFFLAWPTPLPHSPSAVRSILEGDPRAVPFGYLDERPDVQPPREGLMDRLYTMGAVDPRVDGHGWREKVYNAAGMTWLDDGIGALVDELRRQGLLEDTMIVIASDNGHSRGKNNCYEAGTRVPAIVHWPGRVPAGSVCDRLVSNVDLAPTIMAACGVGIPNGMTVDGTDARAVLEDPAATVNESVFNEIGMVRSVVTDDWKYLAVRFPEEVQAQVTDGNRREWSHDGTRDVDHRYGAHVFYPGYFDRDQLYYLPDDPHEQQNLAGDPKFADRLDEMKSRMERYCRGLPHSFGEFSG